MNAPCPLCESTTPDHFHQDRRRDYLRCQRCQLVFVEPRYHLSAEQEKAEYDLHRNSPTDEGYRAFLNRLAEPLQQRLAPNSRGLDFGCGPGPALSVMLEEAGHELALFDIFYANNAKVWQQDYDFICATEVVEHLSQPGQVLQQLWQRLVPGGWLALMTKLVIDQRAFAHWHYKNDPTHICFFSQRSFVWFSQQWQAQLEFIGKDVILIRKPGTS